MTERTEARLDSWKEIAAYLRRGARTVQRWEREEGLPVHRLRHGTLGSVYAFPAELDQWWTQRSAGRPAAEAAAEPSVAVLPFADMSRERDQAYFCEGVAEEITNALGRVEGLRVASRTAALHARTGAADSREIARRLRVRTLLEGSVRQSAGRLRIAVELVDAHTGFQLWAERYDRETRHVFAVQDEIARAVVGALRLALSPPQAARLWPPGTREVRAYDCYLRGRRLYEQYSTRDVEAALRLFSRAVELDPGYPQAHAGLADCWSYLFLYRDRSETHRASAERASLQAITLAPGSAQAWASRGLALSLSGRDQEAADAFAEAVQLDPGLFEAHYYRARHAFAAGWPQAALRAFEEAMRVRPEDYQAPLLAAQIYDDGGRPEEAATVRRLGIERARRHLEVEPEDARALYMAANGMAALGGRERAREWAERARQLRPDDPMVLYNVACIFSLLEMPEPALDCLEKAVHSGLRQRGWCEHDSNLDALRSHQRFQALLRDL
ncbi:MAG TPA: tetratricopeptide repeat protein [Vicinamibacteria bacterium]|nr:tetratricopeptide repeat protein [Vicinamibacteria bacterium]